MNLKGLILNIFIYFLLATNRHLQRLIEEYRQQTTLL
jgi:hypothetical protein